MNTRQVGTKWEEKAVEYLKGKGYVILETNYRCRFGEIDIIAMYDKMICFIEVKYRSGKMYGDAVEAVTLSKQRVIRKTAQNYLVFKIKDENISCRFDVIGFDGDKVMHIQNAF